MITIKKIEYQAKGDPEIVMSKLQWKTHLVEEIDFTKSLNWTAPSNRPLIGKIDNNNQEFKVARLRTISQFYIPRIIVEGRLENFESKGKVIIRYRPGLLTSIFGTLVLYSILKFILTIILSYDYQQIITWNGVQTLIIIPVVIFYLYSREFKRTSQLLNHIFKQNV